MHIIFETYCRRYSTVKAYLCDPNNSGFLCSDDLKDKKFPIKIKRTIYFNGKLCSKYQSDNSGTGIPKPIKIMRFDDFLGNIVFGLLKKKGTDKTKTNSFLDVLSNKCVLLHNE